MKPIPLTLKVLFYFLKTKKSLVLLMRNWDTQELGAKFEIILEKRTISRFP